jgi:hypothetical protein
MPRIPRTVRGTELRTAMTAKQYREAIVECRADITQYTIWHKSHTEPFLAAAPERAQALLNIDIKSLSELVDVLMRCYAKTENAPDIPAVLERLRANIHDPRWHRKLTYFSAVNAYLISGDRSLAKSELTKLEPIIKDSDAETLQLYLDLFGSTLSFSSMLELVDRILVFSTSEADQLHYRTLKAMQYVEIGDNARAEAELDSAIARFRHLRQGDSIGAYAMDVFAPLSICSVGSAKIHNCLMRH